MKSIGQLFDTVGTEIVYPFLYSLISVQSLGNRIKALGQKPTIHWENPHDGKPIALVALYQKGALRPDTITLLDSLKRTGCYVLAVNTMKLNNLDDARDYFDCYIEKYNFGRDFGSYKTGFEHIYQKGWHNNCSRLLMVNDSVFCVSDRIDAFAKEMITSEVEVLGSTENFEIFHHLGSFCISVSQSILQTERFVKFWQKYSNSDVRPRVIYRGEQELSKTLKRCVSTPSQFQALYGSDVFLQRLRSEEGLIDLAILNARNSSLTGWKRFSASKVISELRKKHLLRVTEYPEDAQIQIEEGILQDRIAAVDFEGIIKVAESDLRDGSTIDREKIRRIVISHLTEVFMSGSQIHQNASILLLMGLPIVKLDGLYRGMFSIEDIQMITDHLPEKDALELQALLLERPFGGDALRGMRRAAFMRGLI